MHSDIIKGDTYIIKLTKVIFWRRDSHYLLVLNLNKLNN